jgi:hypothetical protein
MTKRLDIYHHLVLPGCDFGELTVKLDTLLLRSMNIMAEFKNVDELIKALVERVKTSDTKLDSLRTYNEGLRDTLMQALRDKGTLTPAQEQAAAEVFAALDKNDAEVDEAMTANTPEAPANPADPA